MTLAARPSSFVGARAGCVHCGAALPARETEFCCTGCALVHALLAREGLTRYYALREAGDATPATSAATARTEADRAWLAPLEATLADAAAPTALTVDVQGIHCAACVWLVEQVFARQAGALSIVVNPALGKIDLIVDPSFDLRAWVEHVERFGYLLGPSLKDRTSRSSGTLARMGICIAIAMNAMIFAFSRYLGLAEGLIAAMFLRLELVLAFASVAVGGSVFFTSAWRAAKMRVLHLDVPIALGLAFALTGSTWSYFARGAVGSYFDTITVFTALMLVGRFLQERVLLKNQRELLESDGVAGLVTRRLDRERGVVELVPCTDVRAGDELVVAPGDLVPVDATVEDESASAALDWISGESAPRRFLRGARVPAGAFNVGTQAARLLAATPFAESRLVDLLRRTRERENDAARSTPWWRRFARIYVLGVLAAATVAFVGWSLAAGTARALDVTTAVLVVTCPCAFGVATPMAYELVQAGLRRAGLFVRSPSFLDRAQSVRRVFFDKTGTLTTTSLTPADALALVDLAPDDRAALYNLVARSSHPKSAAILQVLRGPGAAFDPSSRVRETPGHGLRLETQGHAYTLDRAGFAVDGKVLAALDVEETLRPDARDEVAALRALGYDVWIVSGDDDARVADMAERLGIARDHAVGHAAPEKKAELVAAHDRGDLLMIGDGINDGFAVERATCSGTPAIDRPFMPARTDFYFTTPGLRPVGLALRASRALARVTRRNLGIAIAYNALAVALAYAGLMSPVVCAVVMPVSSVTVVTLTAFSLRSRSPLWKS